MPYILCRWYFLHKVADFLQAKCDFKPKTAALRFLNPFEVLLGATYDDYVRLIGKRASGLPSVNWTFFARCYGWGATSEYRFEIGDYVPVQRGPVDPKFQIEVAIPHQPFFLSEN